MMKSLKKIIFAAWLLAALSAPFWAGAQSYDFASSSGLTKTADSAGYTPDLKSIQPEGMAAKIVTQVLSWLGVLFLGLIIYGGITWMTAQGNEQKAERAKQIIMAAISGLIVIVGAYAVSYFVIRYFTQGIV